MVVTKIKQAKVKYRECDCWSLTYGIKIKIKKEKRVYKTIHTFTKRIEDKTNTNDNNNKYNNKSNND